MVQNIEGLKYYKPTHENDPVGRERELFAAEVIADLVTYARNNNHPFDMQDAAVANIGARCMYDLMTAKMAEKEAS